MHPTRIDLPASTRSSAVQILSLCLADTIDLALRVKHAHWNVKGPNFIALHEMFDDFVDDIQGHADTIAERITAFGAIADGTLQGVSKHSRLPAYNPQISSGHDHLIHLAEHLAQYGAMIRKAIDETTALGDAGSADLFTGISRDIDKKLWFVESHLQADR